MPSPTGMPQTETARMKVTIEPISTAIQAETRNTASRTRSSTTGMSATSQVSARLPSGFRI